MAFVSLDGGGNVVGIFGLAQNAPTPPGYAVIADNDPRIAVFLATLAAEQATPTVQVVSTGTPALSGTYFIDAGSQQNIQAVSVYVAVNSKFPAGQSAQAWPDTTGTFHSFTTTTEWMAFASSIADYVAALKLGQSPTQPITIP